MIKTVFIDGKNIQSKEETKIYTYYFTSDYYDIDTRKTTIKRHLLKSDNEYNIGEPINVKWNKDKYKWEIVEPETNKETDEELPFN